MRYFSFFYFIPSLLMSSMTSYAFLRGAVRGFHSTSLVMRSKKTVAQEIFDGFSNNRKSKPLAPVYKPKTTQQKVYVNALNNESTSIVFGIGPAGCGKTLFACLSAIQSLKRGDIRKIVLTRPIVPVEEEEIGFLPGTLTKKMDPWTRPIFDTFLEFYHQKELDDMLHNGVIEISPLAFMRGRTFKHCFIIADEMQNSTPNQMFMLTTRIGDKCKLIITGDLKQTDRLQNNGLGDILYKCKQHPLDDEKKQLISLVEMSALDVQRSPIVSHILDIYEGPSISVPNFIVDI